MILWFITEDIIRHGKIWVFFFKNFVEFCLQWVFVAVGGLPSCSAWASHWIGFSPCGARALEHGLSNFGA